MVSNHLSALSLLKALTSAELARASSEQQWRAVESCQMRDWQRDCPSMVETTPFLYAGHRGPGDESNTPEVTEQSGG